LYEWLCVRQARPQPVTNLKRSDEKLVAGFKTTMGEGKDNTEEGEVGGGEEEEADFF
jgi:hypothetical protein